MSESGKRQQDGEAQREARRLPPAARGGANAAKTATPKVYVAAGTSTRASAPAIHPADTHPPPSPYTRPVPVTQLDAA
jgi:hypothetical protein